jgi:hypothetical protein
LLSLLLLLLLLLRPLCQQHCAPVRLSIDRSIGLPHHFMLLLLLFFIVAAACLLFALDSRSEPYSFTTAGSGLLARSTGAFVLGKGGVE